MSHRGRWLLESPPGLCADYDRCSMESLMVRVCNLCGSRETRLQYEIERFHIVRCIQCDLVYVAEEIGEDELVAYYGEAYYTGAQSQGYCDYIGRRKVRK